MIARALVIATSALVLTFSSLSAANAQLIPAGLGGHLSSLGQVRSLTGSVSVLPSTSTVPQADLGVFALMLGFAAVVALFALARRYQPH